MPLQDHHQIVSVDDHLVEHPRVWQDRIPAKFRDEAAIEEAAARLTKLQDSAERNKAQPINDENFEKFFGYPGKARRNTTW